MRLDKQLTVLHVDQVGLVVGLGVLRLDHVGQTLPLACGIVIIEPGLGLAAQTPLRFHPEDHLVHSTIGIGIAQCRTGRASDLRAQINRGFIDQLKRAERHADHLGGVFDQGRGDTLFHHPDAFVDVRNDAAVGVEKTCVVDHDGRLFDLTHKVERLGHGAIPGFLAFDDLDQHHLFDRRKEVDADELLRPRAGLCQIADRQGGCVGCKDAVRADHRFDLCGHIRFDLGVFEHSLYDEVAPRQIVVIRRGGDPGEHRVSLVLRDLLARHALGRVVGGIGLALVRRRLIAVEQHHLDARLSRHQRDARAHHARAQHANLLHALIIDVCRAHGAFFQGLLVDEQRPDHRRRGRVHDHGCEPARLDPQGRVEIHHRAFVDRRQQRLGRRIDALGLAVDHRRGTDKRHETGRMIRRATGHLVALDIPGLDQIGILGRQHPSARIGHRIGGNLVDKASRLGFGRIGQLALEQKGRGRHRTHLARHAGRATRTGEDAHKDFRQTDLGLGVVCGKDAMTGQRDFQPDAKRRARQHGRHRLAALAGLRIHARAFDLAQHAVHFHDPVEHRLGPGIAQAGQHVQVHPGGEIRLA